MYKTYSDQLLLVSVVRLYGIMVSLGLSMLALRICLGDYLKFICGSHGTNRDESVSAQGCKEGKKGMPKWRMASVLYECVCEREI